MNLCPHCKHPDGAHAEGCPRLAPIPSGEEARAWDGTGNNPTLGRLGETSPEETLSQESDEEGDASARAESVSPGVLADRRRREHLEERLNDTLSFAFDMVNTANIVEIVNSGSIPPGVYEVDVRIMTVAAPATNRRNVFLLQQDLPVGDLVATNIYLGSQNFPRVTVRPGEAIRLLPKVGNVDAYFGVMILTMRESYGRSELPA